MSKSQIPWVQIPALPVLQVHTCTKALGRLMQNHCAAVQPEAGVMTYLCQHFLRATALPWQGNAKGEMSYCP